MIYHYNTTPLPDNFSIEGIVTVSKHTFSVAPGPIRGESHDFPEILYITKGRHKLLLDDTDYILSAGQLIIYAPGAYHTSREKNHTEGLILSFRISTEAILPLCNQVITLTSLQKQTFLQIIEDGLSCFRGVQDKEIQQGFKGMALKDSADKVTLQRIKKQLEFFLTDISSNLRPQDAKQTRRAKDFEQVVDFFNRHISENLTLTQIADGCGMSVSKLKLLFRENSGGGAIDYFIALKIDRAQELIRKGDMNFTQIADSLGFHSLHYFSRTFKKITSYSPSQFAKMK